MNTKHALMLSVSLLACAVLLTFLQAFSFAPPWYPFCKRLDELSFTSASAQPPTLVFEDPGTIKVMHGSGCAHSKDDFLKVDQGDAEHFCKSGGTPSGSDTFFFAENTGTSTALSWFRSFLSNANFASDGTAAVLPRGFGFRYLSFDEDHHVLQVAYNLEHSE